MIISILLIALIVALLLMVELGALALEVTGLPREKAFFQSLSAFTTTGFTTHESETIMRLPIRRKIISVLIVLGYISSISIMALLTSLLVDFFKISDTPNDHQDMAVILGGGLVVIILMLCPFKIKERLKNRIFLIIKKYFPILQSFSVEEILQVSKEVGIMRGHVAENSPLIGKPLRDLSLTAERLHLLTIYREGDVVAVPTADDILRAGDQVLCYGSQTAMHKFFAYKTQDHLTVVFHHG